MNQKKLASKEDLSLKKKVHTNFILRLRFENMILGFVSVDSVEMKTIKHQFSTQMTSIEE